MSKTHPNPGKLQKELSVTIGSQESAYRTLLFVPFLSSEDKGALTQAIVEGPELSWIRLAFYKDLFPAYTVVRRTSIERFLARGGVENTTLVLQSEECPRIRSRAIKQLTENPKSAYTVLRAGYLCITNQELTLLLDAILPTLTGRQAYILLVRHLYNRCQPPLEVGIPRRLKLIEGLRKSEYGTSVAVELLLHQSGTRGKKFSEPFTDAERKILVGLAIKHDGCAYSLLFPLSEERNAQLTEDELVVVVPVAFEYLKEELSSSRHDEERVAHARQLLKQFGALLSKEQRQELQALVQHAKAKAT